MYMISKEWQILWVLDESAFCNDQLWHKCQSYFYISLILSTHRHFLLACTSCWNVAHYQSHCFDLLYRPLLADFLLFSSCQKLLSKREERTGDKYAAYSSEHKISSKQHSQSHGDCNTAGRGGRWGWDGLLTVLVDFPAEVLLAGAVFGAILKEVSSGLGGSLLSRDVVMEEGVSAQGILVAVALVAL